MRTIATFVIAALMAATSAQADDCTSLPGYPIVRIAGHMDTWGKFNDIFTRFRHCDDGAIGQGFSEAVARLLADKWARVVELDGLARKSPEFEQFVLKHIDATLSERDLRKIEKLALTACPRGRHELCSKIGARSSEARKNL